MYDTILDALRRGDSAAALTAAHEAVAAQPQDPQAQRLLATALRTSGDASGAMAAIERAIALAPDDATLHMARAGLLLDERQLDEAQAALARTLGLDPNQFPAYVVQGQLAMARGDLDEAERLARTAARIAPEHPQVAAIEGMVALRRGDADRALAILSRAAERTPQEPQLRHALGFAYMAKGHLAFAEQAFRGLLENNPESRPLRALIADLLRHQDRPGDAADMLAPLLDHEPTAGLQRMVGVLELEAGRPERALPLLRSAFEGLPGDRVTLGALVEAWRRNDAADEARSTLDAALAARAEDTALWHARLAFESFASDGARAVIERWLAATPDAIPALTAQVAMHDAAGEREQGDAVARRITEIEPGHTQAEFRVIDSLLRSDGDAAVARVDSLHERASDDATRRNLRQLKAATLDAAGRPAEAAALWAARHAEVAEQRLPYPPVSAARSDWPELAPLPEAARGVLLLWGAPGSQVERLAATFAANSAPLRLDRYGPTPPNDLFQRYTSVEALHADAGKGEALVAEWRDQLAASGFGDGAVFDWLLWWDNALLNALRPHLPEAVLMIALRDPRDMLLNWLAGYASAPFRIESPLAAARWLAQVLGQVAYLHEQDLFPHHLIRLDEIADNPEALSQALNAAIGTNTAPVRPQALGQKQLPVGRWRAYAEPLAEAFAVLAPVAKRLGYAD